MLKTLLFILVVYLLIRAVSRLFLSPEQKGKGSAKIFYHIFKNIQHQQNRQQSQNNKRDRFEEIEEAEFEEINDEETDSPS